MTGQEKRNLMTFQQKKEKAEKQLKNRTGAK